MDLSICLEHQWVTPPEGEHWGSLAFSILIVFPFESHFKERSLLCPEFTAHLPPAPGLCLSRHQPAVTPGKERRIGEIFVSVCPLCWLGGWRVIILGLEGRTCGHPPHDFTACLLYNCRDMDGINVKVEGRVSLWDRLIIVLGGMEHRFSCGSGCGGGGAGQQGSYPVPSQPAALEPNQRSPQIN